MRTTLLADATALALVPTWAAAEPLRLTDAQLGEVAAGVELDLFFSSFVFSDLVAFSDVTGNSAIGYAGANAEGENTFTFAGTDTSVIAGVGSAAEALSIGAAGNGVNGGD